MSRFDARAGCLRSELLSVGFPPDGPDSELVSAGTAVPKHPPEPDPSLERPWACFSEDIG